VVNAERWRIADGKARAVLASGRMAAVLGRRLGQASGRAALVEERIGGAFRALLAKRMSEWERLSASLQALSPLDVLKKGYAVVWKEGTPRIPVTRAESLRPGDAVEVSFQRGEFIADVRTVDPVRPVTVPDERERSS